MSSQVTDLAAELAALDPVAASRWYGLRPHKVRDAYRYSNARFNICAAGRRSGKTEHFKRKVIRKAMSAHAIRPDARFFAAAPTRDQAKRIFWNDLKKMVPKQFLAGDPSESELTIKLINGAEIVIVGLDKPERMEGSPWDGGGIDEIANVKPTAWSENIRPCLSDRLGWCDFTGVPEGRNHYYDLAERAKAEELELGKDAQWRFFHWVSADILPPAEIEAAKRDLDELTFDQEYNANFVNFAGRAYYSFDPIQNVARLDWRDFAPLIICFDFNVDPGVAAICQEMTLPNGLEGTGVLGEVYIERSSNTARVCRKIIEDWGMHQGIVRLYGDATGGSRGSAKLAGSDWDIIQDCLRPVFGSRLEVCVGSSNPPERARVNAMNSRLCSAAGQRRLFVDPVYAPKMARDLDGVRVIPGSAGELDKHSDKKLTHISDALGYYVEAEFPVNGPGVGTATTKGV